MLRFMPDTALDYAAERGVTMLLRLLAVFWQIGLFSIGGGYAVIPSIREQVVERYGWLTSQTFTDILTISQMTPGPLAVNASTFVGIQTAGLPGAIVATFGCVISGILISILLYRFFQKNRNSGYVMETLNGLRAASTGLILSACATILLLTLCGVSTLGAIAYFDWPACLLFLISLVILRKWKANPILLMLGTGFVGFIVYTLF